MEAVGIKVKITIDMVGKTAWILTDEEKNQVADWGEYIAIKFMPGVDQRSLEQNNLYWKCLEIYCENKSDDFEYNTKDKCHSQVRWAVKYINKESAVHFMDKNGNSKLYFELDSISFKTPQKKANQYYDNALKHIADDLGLTVEELISEAKGRMKARRICKLCGKSQKIQGHHKFPQYKNHKELYPDFINHPDNLLDICVDCHMVKSIPTWSEKEFCEHFKIEVRSKGGINGFINK